jgi:hypothetical protein
LSGWLLRCNGGMDTPLSLLVLILILILVLVLVLVLSLSSSSSCHRHRHHSSSSSFIVWLVVASGRDRSNLSVFVQQAFLDFAQGVKLANVAARALLCVMLLRREIGKSSERKPSKYCQPQRLSLRCQKWWSSVVCEAPPRGKFADHLFFGAVDFFGPWIF